MARCWTCGAYHDTTLNDQKHYFYTCDHCAQLNLYPNGDYQRFNVSSTAFKTMGHGRYRHDPLSDVQQQSVQVVRRQFTAKETTSKPSTMRLASAIVWRIQIAVWQVWLLNDPALVVIPNTPSQDRAEMFRAAADQLASLGCWEEAECDYLWALNFNPSDYRIYISLAFLYLSHERFEQAKDVLTQSLACAPQGVIHYASYSYRLLGRLYACDEDYECAREALATATTLSPQYSDAHYDYAQYCAELDDIGEGLIHLEKAIEVKPLYALLAQSAQSFFYHRDPVNRTLSKATSKVVQLAQSEVFKIEQKVQQIDSELDKAKALIERTSRLAERVGEGPPLRAFQDAVQIRGSIDSHLAKAKHKSLQRDPLAVSDSLTFATQAIPLADKTLDKLQLAKQDLLRAATFHEQEWNNRIQRANYASFGLFIGSIVIALPVGFIGYFIANYFAQTRLMSPDDSASFATGAGITVAVAAIMFFTYWGRQQILRTGRK